MQYSLDIDVMNEVYKTVGRLMIPGDYAGLLNCNCNTEKEEKKVAAAAEQIRVQLQYRKRRNES